jgi:eukaryotic-like serine/threonine-protein kinase
MGHELASDTEREEHRNQILLDYVEALEAGHEPDRGKLLAEHPDLRSDLETFLAGHDEVARLTAPLRAAEVGGTTAPESPFRDEPEERTPGIGELGDFRLLREVGRGGMGVVYEAEQISLRRRVALKVLPFAAAIDSRRLQRFKTEALTSAQIQHERIVPVHAVGCERGVHYFAMQFIDGQSLAALIGELRRLRGEQGSGASWVEAERVEDDHGVVALLRAALPTSSTGGDATLAATTISRERSTDRNQYFDRMAGLGRQAALALEHAHQAGIVHRDVKPGNLLLDLRAQLWVTDFGLAQVIGDPGLTITGELLGTLRYASPEQVLARRGIVDHRSDVYSLGATLYELLTLRPPFEGRDRNALIQEIAAADPPMLRELDRSIPAALETIVLKALRKDPADRYGTAQEMADELERFLDRRPILARRPTPAERLRAWSRRHPAIVGVGVVGLILLSTASMVSTALVRREQARTLMEQRKAEAAYRRERQRAEEAEARFRLARRSVDELIRVSEEELAHRPGMEGLRKRLLASALAYYREFIDQRTSDPAAQAELRDTTRRVETILADLAVLRAAGELYLLAQSTAQNDLRLDEAQRAKVADLSERAGRRWTEAFGDRAHLRAAVERVRLVLDQARANEAEVDAILTRAQRVRLRKIALLSEGPAAFREPEVVEALGLTSGQREQIRAIEEELLFAQMREMRLSRPAEDAGKPAIERILAVLTPDQGRRWKELTGEPIVGPLSPFPAPFRLPRDPKQATH